jgi:hypothetical protein
MVDGERVGGEYDGSKRLTREVDCVEEEALEDVVGVVVDVVDVVVSCLEAFFLAILLPDATLKNKLDQAPTDVKVAVSSLLEHPGTAGMIAGKEKGRKNERGRLQYYTVIKFYARSRFPLFFVLSVSASSPRRPPGSSRVHTISI